MVKSSKEANNLKKKKKNISKNKNNKNNKKVVKVKKILEIDNNDPKYIFYTTLWKENPKSEIAIKFVKKYNIKI